MLGLLGGAFDPPHNGHVALAEAAIEQLALERLLVLVGVAPGHKPVETPVDQRLRLAQAAFGPVARAEVVRDDHAFTIDALREGDFAPEDTVFVVGADQLAGFLAWREPDEVLEHARLAVGTRPGFPRERLEPVLVELEHPERVGFFTVPEVPVSSREIRALAGRGEPVEELVPPAVARLMADLGLYRGVDRLPSGELP